MNAPAHLRVVFLVGFVISLTAAFAAAAIGSQFLVSHHLAALTTERVTGILLSSAAILLYGSLAYGFKKGRPWVRGLSVVQFLCYGLLAAWQLASGGDALRGTGSLVLYGIAPAVLTYWYFFRKPDTVGYFHAAA